MIKLIQTYENGIYDISNEDYHKGDGISRSGIMLFKKSPLHYWDRYENPERVPMKETPQQLLGTVTHKAILEPKAFAEDYVFEEKVDRRTKEGKARAEELLDIYKGKTIVDLDTFEKIMGMRDSFISHPNAKDFLKGSQIEKSIFWQDPQTNIQCKARPDIYIPDKSIVVDLKTTTDASMPAFQRAMANYGYHIQAAMIRDGIYHATKKVIQHYVFIAIETVAPYAIGVYILDGDAIDRGHNEYVAILNEFKDRKKENAKVWPSYSTCTVSLPAYYV
jgi:exodeoxyribonuclease VIII